MAMQVLWLTIAIVLFVSSGIESRIESRMFQGKIKRNDYGNEVLYDSSSTSESSSLIGDLIKPTKVTCKCNPPCDDKDTCTIYGSCYISGTGSGPMFLGCLGEETTNELCNHQMIQDIGCCNTDLCNDYAWGSGDDSNTSDDSYSYIVSEK
ncbi:uncharacterized protein LOC144435848 [Glandiceps talaboti]